MKLLTKALRNKLLTNGRAQEKARGTEQELDFDPVVKLFDAFGEGIWLLTELNNKDPDVAFGLCDLGNGHAELGYVRISELEKLRCPWGPRIERDRFWSPKMTLAGYVQEANKAAPSTETQ